MKVEARVTSIQVNPKEKTSWNAELVTLSLSRPSRKHKWQLALLPETLKKAKVLDLIHFLIVAIKELILQTFFLYLRCSSWFISLQYLANMTMDVDRVIDLKVILVVHFGPSSSESSILGIDPKSVIFPKSVTTGYCC